MRKTIIFLAIIAVLSSCNSSSTVKFKRSAPDTVFTLVEAYNPLVKAVVHEHFWRITKDTYAIAKVDTLENGSINGVRQWMRDTFYFAPFPIVQKDSSGKVLLTSRALDSVKYSYDLFPRQAVFTDYNKRFEDPKK